MKMTINVRCAGRWCKRRLQFDCDAREKPERLTEIAAEHGWEWKTVPRCPEHHA